jgi:hypothetical protein
MFHTTTNGEVKERMITALSSASPMAGHSNVYKLARRPNIQASAAVFNIFPINQILLFKILLLSFQKASRSQPTFSLHYLYLRSPPRPSSTIMVSTTFLFLAPFALMVSAGCYHAGDEGSMQTANNGLTAVCNTMQGWFVDGQTRTGCVSVPTDSHYWYFEARKTDGAGTLTFETCEAGLKARYCDGKGGDNRGDGWFFR